MKSNLSKSVLGLQIKKLRKNLQKIKYRWYLSHKKTDEVFDEIFKKNNWGDTESVSGPGSRLDRTDKIRKALPALLSKYECRSLLDLPCGDYNWMKTLDLDGIVYIGGDIVNDLIQVNQKTYSTAKKKFMKLDLLKDLLPKSDMILCRDCLVHLSSAEVQTALMNIKKSGSRYLLTTTFPERKKNDSIVTGEWRPVNLTLSPFLLPAPLELVDDSYDSPNYFDKHLGLWKIEDLTDF